MVKCFIIGYIILALHNNTRVPIENCVRIFNKHGSVCTSWKNQIAIYTRKSDGKWYFYPKHHTCFKISYY
jgi:hypothetical protein